MITVMGATGDTGKKIAEKLLIAGERVRAVARTESKLAELQNPGVAVWAGDANDAAFLTKALMNQIFFSPSTPPAVKNRRHTKFGVPR